MEDFLLIVFALCFLILGIYLIVWQFQDHASVLKETKKLKRKMGYNKRIKGEIRNVCNECGKVWFYGQAKVNALTENVIARKNAARTGANTMGINWLYGQGNTVLNQSVLQGMQLNEMAGQTTAAQLESLRKCPDCNSNNVKRTQASSRTSSKSNISDLPKLNDNISIEAKLEKAKNLYEKKLIDESDYKQMKTKLLKNMDFDEGEGSEIDKTPKSKAYHCQDCNFKSRNRAPRCPNCMSPNFVLS